MEPCLFKERNEQYILFRSTEVVDSRAASASTSAPASTNVGAANLADRFRFSFPDSADTATRQLG